MRVIIASSLSEFIFTIIVFLIKFIGKTSYNHIFKLMLISFLTKLVVSYILVIPISLIVTLIKNSIQGDENQIDRNHATIVNKLTELYSSTNVSYFKEIDIDHPISHPLGSYSKPIEVTNLQFRTFTAGKSIVITLADNPSTKQLTL